MRLADRNVKNSPEYYGSGERAIWGEAVRLCELFNSKWSYHLNADDVSALIAADRLHDLTHVFTPGEGWRLKKLPHVPTPREVNQWNISGFGHDSINQWICVKAECVRLGIADSCDKCGGEGDLWPSPDAKKAYDDWQIYEPPLGDGYQIWETVSEGSPISPVFSTARDLAAHMATTKWGADKGTSFETWLKFIEGPGWAPSMIGTAESGLMDGVSGIVAIKNNAARS